MTIEIEPRPTVLGNLPFALISDAASKTTGVSVASRAVCRGSSSARSARGRHPTRNYGTPSCTQGGVQNLKISLWFRLLSIMSSALKVISLLAAVAD